MTPAAFSTTPPAAPTPGFGAPKPDRLSTPTLRTESAPDPQQRTVIGLLVAAIVVLSVMVAVLGATLRHVSVASNQPCVEPIAAPSAPAGAGEAHLPSAASISPTPTVNPSTDSTAPTAAAAAASTAPAASTTADTNDYLSFLQGIDQRRTQLLAAANIPSTQDSSSAPTSTDTWQALLADFQKRSVPEPFSAFANEYMTFLVDCQSDSGKSADQLGALSSEALKLDGDLDRLCTQQNVTKTFNITPPPASPAASSSSTPAPSTTSAPTQQTPPPASTQPSPSPSTP